MDSIPLKLESKIDIFKDRKHSNWRLFGCRQQKMRVTNGTKCSAYGISQFIFFGFRILFVVSVVHVWMDRRTRTDFTQKKIPDGRIRIFPVQKSATRTAASNNERKRWEIANQ